MYEGRAFGMCGDDGVDGGGGSGVFRNMFFVCGRVGLFGSAFYDKGGIFELGWGFVVLVMEVEVNNLKLVVGCVMRPI